MEERATIARERYTIAGAGTFLFTYSVTLEARYSEDNAGAQSIMADFSRALNDAYRQLRELLSPRSADVAGRYSPHCIT